MRLSMKIKDPAKNEERLRKQRECKRNYRQKMKAAAALSESQQDTTSSSTSRSTAVEGFSQRSTYMRSLRKPEKRLPENPRKKAERKQKAVVTSLAKKFDLKIAPRRNNRGRKRQEITEEELSWLSEFLSQPDITYVTPGKKDQIYMRKLDGQKMFRQKKYLLWTLNDLLDIVNGCSVSTNENNTFVTGFNRKLSFRQLNEFIKSNKQYIYNKNIPHATCLCEICENAVYFMKELNNWLPNRSEMSINPDDIAERFSCDSSFDVCMYSNCDECGSHQGDEIIREGQFDGDGVVYYEWKNINGRVQKVAATIDVEEIVRRLNQIITALKRHIHTQHIQHACLFVFVNLTLV